MIRMRIMLARAKMDNFSSYEGCFNYSQCPFPYKPCAQEHLHPDIRYSNASAAWVLIASIIVFFMKAGFMLMELAFAKDPDNKRHVVVLKHQDAFASAFGFFLIGFDVISNYETSKEIEFFNITDPGFWFFKFTFASNAATIIGGCLVNNSYKLRIPAAFVSAFVISGIIHPIVARIIWSDQCNSFSPYRFCNFKDSPIQENRNCSCNQTYCENSPLDFIPHRIYVLDFAGGGAVHLIGGIAGLMVCLFAKFQEWRDRKRPSQTEKDGVESQEDVKQEGFWDWMYPVNCGNETVPEAALGVLILWFCWFAFNCGSAESIETGFKYSTKKNDKTYPFYGIPAVIAVNMIMACASGGTLAIIIAVCAQVRFRTKSINANEIANGILSALVSITAGCAFVPYWGGVLIGFLGVIFYHLGCFLEYKLKIKDTARVVPVHGICGLWSVIATGLFILPTGEGECNLHATFEGLCYCELRLPTVSYGERLGAQIIGALFMIVVGLVGSFITYFILYIIPVSPFVWLIDKMTFHFLSPKDENGERRKLVYRGGWLLTSPEEDFERMDSFQQHLGDNQQVPLIRTAPDTSYRNERETKVKYSESTLTKSTLHTYNTMDTPRQTIVSAEKEDKDKGDVVFRGRNAKTKE